MEDNMISVQEVAYLVGCSIQTIGAWYKFKRENPENEYSMMLPDFQRCGKRQTRYWKREDVSALIAFKEQIPKGRNGVLGSVTQRYAKKSGDGDKGKKTSGKLNKTGVFSVNYIEKVQEYLLNYDVEAETVEQIVELLESERAWKQRLVG